MGTRVTSDFKLHTGKFVEGGKISTLNQASLTTSTSTNLISKCQDTGLYINWDKSFEIKIYFVIPSSSANKEIYLCGENEHDFYIKRLANGNIKIVINGVDVWTFTSVTVADTGYYFVFTYSITTTGGRLGTNGFGSGGGYTGAGISNAARSGMGATTLKMFQPYEGSTTYAPVYSNVFNGMTLVPDSNLSQALLQTPTNVSLQSKCVDTGLKLNWDSPFRINMYFKLPSSAIGTTVFLFGESATGFRVVAENKTINQQQLYNIVLYSHSNLQQAMLAHPSYTFSQLSADVGYYVSFTWDASNGTYKTYSLTVSTESFDSSGTNGTTDLGAWGQTDAMSTGVSSSTLKLFQPSYTSNYPAFYSNVFSGMTENTQTGTETTKAPINTSFVDNSVYCTQFVENQYLNFNNKTYLKIFSHDIRTNDSMFKNLEDAKFNVTSANKFSRLEDIPIFTSNSSTQVGVSGMQSRVDGTYYWFGFGNQSSKNVICNIKIVLTKNDGTSDTLQYNGFNIEAKKMYYVQLSETTYNYANIYFDDDYDYFIWSSSFSQGFYLTYGWGKSEDILFQIGNKLNYLIPGYSSLGINSNDFFVVNKPKYEFLLNYSPTLGRLPTDYIELDYIESDGNQYIDSNVTLNMNTDGYEIKCQSTNSTQNGMVLGDWVNGSYYYWLYYYNSGSAVRMYLTDTSATQTYYETYINSSNTNVVTYSYQNKYMYANESLTQSSTTTFSTPQGTCTLFRVKGSNGDNYTFKGRIYYCKLYQNGNLVRDLVPAKHRTTGVLGMYDVLNNHFYQNVGSGTFTAGPKLMYNIWTQTANPLTTQSNSSQTTTSMGYVPIEINMTSQWDYGMGLSSSPTEAYLDCNAGSPDWFGGIGQYVVWNSGFPAPDGSARKFVELYVRIDNVDGFTGKASIRNNKCIFMDEFIEE